MVTIHVLLQGSTEEDVRLLRFAVEGGREQAVAREIRFKKKKKGLLTKLLPGMTWEIQFWIWKE